MGLLSSDNCRKYLFWTVQLVGIAIVVLTLIHIFNYRGGFGGRNNPKQEFSWHVFFMTLGFTYFSGNALVTFRLLPLMPKMKMKWIHLVLNSGVIICAILGLIFVIDERDTQGNAHFISLHSWLGISAITLLVIQFTYSAFVFMAPKSPPTLREKAMPWHVSIGISMFLLGTGAIITELKKGRTESERLLVNFTGALVMIFCFLVLYILTKENYKFSYRVN